MGNYRAVSLQDTAYKFLSAVQACPDQQPLLTCRTAQTVGTLSGGLQQAVSEFPRLGVRLSVLFIWTDSPW